MKTEEIKRGDDLMLFQGAEKKALAMATSHTFNLTADVVEISCKDSGAWKDNKVNKLGWEITSENLYCIAGYDEVYDLMLKREPIDVYFGTKSTTDAEKDGLENSPTDRWTAAAGSKLKKGKAVITNLSVNAASGDNATYSVTLLGTGAIATADELGA